MQIWTMIAAFLLLQCWVSMVRAEGSQTADISNYPTVGTISFGGSNIRVFEIDGVQITRPIISFANSCDSLRYNHLYQKYQLTLPMKVEANVLKTATDRQKSIGKLVLTKLKVKADKALASKDSELRIMAKLTKVGEAQLVFLCDTYTRCQRVRDDVVSNPEEMLQALRIVPIGRVGSGFVMFGAFRFANLPKFNCPAGQWVVFQRRVDGSLSFAQNWDAYVKGFGSPKSNYWMGLNKLFAMTVTSVKNTYPDSSRCELRVETEDFQGKNYWGEYKLFEVLGPEQNYQLRVGQQVAGSQIDMLFHNERAFSTYDKDHDADGHGSCSQKYGFGGWWYAGCHATNLNGAYTTDTKINSNPVYNTVYTGKFIHMKSTLMKFRCF